MFPIRDLNPTRLTAYVTIALVAVNLLVFVFWQPHNAAAARVFLYEHAAISCEVVTGEPLTLQEINSDRCLPPGSGVPVFAAKQPATSVFVSMFLHGGIAHILGNLWFLWLFGNNVEEAFGHLRYLFVYLLGGVVAALAFVVLHPESTIPLVGASGAIAAVLGAYLVLFPTKTVMSVALLMVIPVPAVVFLGLWFVGQFFVGEPGVAWESHVAGFVLGALITLVFREPLIGRVRALQGPRRMVSDD